MYRHTYTHTQCILVGCRFVARTASDWCTIKKLLSLQLPATALARAAATERIKDASTAVGRMGRGRITPERVGSIPQHDPLNGAPHKVSRGGGGRAKGFGCQNVTL